MQVEALDRDDRITAHAELRFILMEQTPRIPSSQMFFINSITGEVSLTAEGQSQLVTVGEVSRGDTHNVFVQGAHNVQLRVNFLQLQMPFLSILKNALFCMLQFGQTTLLWNHDSCFVSPLVLTNISTNNKHLSDNNKKWQQRNAYDHQPINCCVYEPKKTTGWDLEINLIWNKVWIE